MKDVNETIKMEEKTKKDSLDNSLDAGIIGLFTDHDSEEFSYGFYEAQKAIETIKSMGISNGKYLISFYDEDLPKLFCGKEFLFAEEKELKEMNGKGSYVLVIPKHSLNTLYAEDFKEIREAMNEYLKRNGKNEKNNGNSKRYQFKRIKDLDRVPFFDSPVFIRAYKLARLGYLASDVKHFDLPKIHKSSIDEDLDSVCVLNDKIKNIGNNSYLILETQCFNEFTVSKKQVGYSAIIVGKLVDFKRIKKENGLEEVIGAVESVDKNDKEKLFKACKEYGFRGNVGIWKIDGEEIVPFKYTKLNINRLK